MAKFARACLVRHCRALFDEAEDQRGMPVNHDTLIIIRRAGVMWGSIHLSRSISNSLADVGQHCSTVLYEECCSLTCQDLSLGLVFSCSYEASPVLSALRSIPTKASNLRFLCLRETKQIESFACILSRETKGNSRNLPVGLICKNRR